MSSPHSEVNRSNHTPTSRITIEEDSGRQEINIDTTDAFSRETDALSPLPMPVEGDISLSTSELGHADSWSPDANMAYQRYTGGNFEGPFSTAWDKIASGHYDVGEPRSARFTSGLQHWDHWPTPLFTAPFQQQQQKEPSDSVEHLSNQRNEDERLAPSTDDEWEEEPEPCVPPWLDGIPDESRFISWPRLKPTAYIRDLYRRHAAHSHGAQCRHDKSPAGVKLTRPPRNFEIPNSISDHFAPVRIHLLLWLLPRFH